MERYKFAQREILPVKEMEKEFPELLEINRPPNTTPEQYLTKFLDTLNDVILDIAKYDINIKHFANSLSKTEIEYLKTAKIIEKSKNNKFLSQINAQNKKRLNHLMEKLLIEAQNQADLFKTYNHAIHDILKTLNKNLNHVTNYTPISLEDIKVIITPMESYI